MAPSSANAALIDAVGQTGGHLGSGLGVVELTAAIHYVFDTPQDKLVWDVGHQCYPHKILTGRRDRIRTLRQGGGLSGFTKRSESEYDPFGAAHSSTSISAALGFAMANKMQDRPGRGIAVIGDGAMSAGMAYEAMNNAEQAGNRLVVILNDNDMSIAPPVGGLSAYLARMVSSSEYLGLRTMASKIAKKLGRRVWGGLERAEEYARGMATGGTLFEELGFYYVGPIDGHNLEHLIPVLENVRDSEQGPVLIHVVTQKGKGYAPAENSADKYHGVAKFDVATGKQFKGAPAPAGAPPKPSSLTSVFANELCRIAETDRDIIGITGRLFKTKTGEITVRAESYTLVSKSLRPLPEKWAGLTDDDKIYRQRYLDLIVNQESRERFRQRAKIIQEMRKYLWERDFTEVETPMLQSLAGGAAARARRARRQGFCVDGRGWRHN